MSEHEQQKKNERTAMVTTIAINALVLLVLFFIAAWKAPNPPNPEYGIEINFGTESTGSGNIQPKDPVGSEQVKEDVQESQQQQEVPTESNEAKVEEAKPSETVPIEQTVTSKIESPVKVKEVKKEEAKPIEKPKEKAPEKKVEQKVEEKPKANPIAAYNPNKSNTENASSKAGKPGGEGDDVNKAGDKGSPEGKPDANAYFGKPGGGGGGFGLQMSGWDWDQTPKAPAIPDDHAGIVVFEIEVDEQGDIINITTKEKTLSPEAVKLCRQEIEKRSLVRKAGGVVPQRSKGLVVFNLTIK